MLNTQEVATALGVSPKRVRELIREDRLKATQNPKSFKWEVSQRSLKSYVLNGKNKKGAVRHVDRS